MERNKMCDQCQNADTSKTDTIVGIGIISLCVLLIWGILFWSWVNFDCYMRDQYARENYGYEFTKEQCLVKRQAEGHWY